MYLTAEKKEELFSSYAVMSPHMRILVLLRGLPYINRTVLGTGTVFPLSLIHI